jgi:hypothetical protein
MYGEDSKSPTNRAETTCINAIKNLHESASPGTPPAEIKFPHVDIEAFGKISQILSLQSGTQCLA